MKYNILDVHIIFENKKLLEVMVLWESNSEGWVRASYANTQPCSGYMFLTGTETVCTSLFQQVAASGLNLSDKSKKKYFPGKWKWEK